jgi:hypothetical protein
MLNFVFELYTETPVRGRANLTACVDRIAGNDHSGDWPRFSETAVLPYLVDAEIDFSESNLNHSFDRYVYATSTYNGPHTWAGWPGNAQGFRSLFDYIPQMVLQDLRQGRAVLLIDQLMEGYSDDRLYVFFHAELQRLALPTRCLIYASGNAREAQRYAAWHAQQDLTDPIVMLSLPHLEFVTRGFFSQQPQLSWRDYAHHATEHARSPLLYNCQNRANRYHRNVMFMHLWHSDLLDQGLISCEKLDWAWRLVNDGWQYQQVDAAKAHLPRIIDFTDFNTNPAMEVTRWIYQNSRISVITETLGDDEPDQLFVTEKPFKSIYALHPFMVLAQRGHLAQLRDWGYATFADFWDESYDQLSSIHKRAAAITANLCALRDHTDLWALHADLRPVLEHNRSNFLRRGADTADLRRLIAALHAAVDN